jgi:methylenetetrahydrofolate reductase (NADPH)
LVARKPPEETPSTYTPVMVQLAFPGSGDLAGRVSTARAIKRAGFVSVPIIAARRLRSEDMLGEYLAALRAANASERVLVVAGDPAEPEAPYPDAATVIGFTTLRRSS